MLAAGIMQIVRSYSIPLHIPDCSLYLGLYILNGMRLEQGHAFQIPEARTYEFAGQ